jgi:hypothetical protein
MNDAMLVSLLRSSLSPSWRDMEVESERQFNGIRMRFARTLTIPDKLLRQPSRSKLADFIFDTLHGACEPPPRPITPTFRKFWRRP